LTGAGLAARRMERKESVTARAFFCLSAVKPFSHLAGRMRAHADARGPAS
jgi:hypothetical protein